MTNSEPGRDTRVHEIFADERLSPLKRYALLAVGTPNLGSLILYELVVLLCSWIPGAAGYAIRRMTYRWILGGMGSGVTVGKNVVIRGGRKIKLGDGVFVDDHCVLDARGEADITIEKGVLVARNTVIRARDGSILIRDGSDIGCNCIIGTDSRVEIGRDVLIAAYAYVVAGGNHVIDDPDLPIIRQGTRSRGGIQIGDGAWIGARVTILDGVAIGEGAVLGAHALATKDIPARTIAQGIPAQVIRDRGRSV